MSARTSRNRRPRRLYFAVALAAAMAPALVAMNPAIGQPVVQPLPDPAAGELKEALQLLSTNPQALSALLDAGRASLRLGDVDAAAGFFARAQAIAPSDGRVLTGLARVALVRQDAIAALQFFDRAAALGEPLEAFAGERGLAYDLVGMNTRAQVLYGQALGRAEDAEIVRRLALSYAISGDADASEATLLPLLQAQDLAAFRTRAFALAIGGRADEAVSITETMLPPRIAQRLSPYLRDMHRLTRVQQAATANFGTFPHPTEIGRDDPAIAAFAAGEPARLASAQRGSDARLIPGGAPLGPAGAEDRRIELPPVDGAAQVTTPAAAPPGPPPGAAAPPPASSDAAARVDLAGTFADFELPAGPPTAPAPDAVDITRIVPARDPAPAPAQEEVGRRLPVNPSRHWVQLATGQDVARFRFDWRRIGGTAQGLLDGRQPYFAAWGVNNRLVTGPFSTESEAQALVTRLAANGVASFVFTSGDGERVLTLPGPAAD